MATIRSDNFKVLLEERGETLRGFSQRTGLHYESVRRMYHDKVTNYNRDTLATMCIALDCGIADLLRLDTTPTTTKNPDQ